MPRQAARRVPTMRPIKMEIEAIKPLAKACRATITKIVTQPTRRFFGSPKSLAVADPPPRFWMPTGIKVKPIVVIKVPVTTGGKSLLILEKTPAMRKTKPPATMIDPYMVPMEYFCPIISKGATAWMAQPKTTVKPIPK